jgi:propionyl-CoA synthetase
MGRTDDVINVAGHRLSTGLMEEVVSAHPAVAECAVIGCRDTLKGEVPCGLIVLKAGVSTDPGRVADEVVALVRERIGPVAALRRVVAVDRLPKTRSGKILRATIKRIADGEVYAAPATIEDPTVLAEIEGALASKQGQPG